MFVTEWVQHCHCSFLGYSFLDVLTFSPCIHKYEYLVARIYNAAYRDCMWSILAVAIDAKAATLNANIKTANGI